MSRPFHHFATDMSSNPPQTADAVLYDSYLEVRAKLLEIAATLDRIDRAAENQATGNQTAGNRTTGNRTALDPESEAHRTKLLDGMRICLSDDRDRAARLQQLFSSPFDETWRKEMSL